MKKSKKITNKNNSYRKLSISILIAITIFLTGSVYAATNFGVGPFSSFLPIPSINRVSDFDDPLVSNAVQKKANDAANLAVTKVARLEQEVKADPTPKKVKDLQEAQAEEVVAVNVSALAAKVVVDTNNSNTKTDLQFGSVADTAGVNSTYNALKAATEKKLLQEGVIETVKVIDGSYTKEFVNKFSINTPKMEEIKNQFANRDVKTNAGTCGTNGAPVLEGTWVSTGEAFTNKDGVTDSTQRVCVKCGKDGKYEGSQTCASVLTQGQPVVLPQQAGGVYTGISDKNITLSSCFSKVNGTLTQIAIGQSQGDTICAPTGSMISKKDIPEDVVSKLNDYCKLTNQEWKEGKCQSAVVITQESLQSELGRAKIDEMARQKEIIELNRIQQNPYSQAGCNSAITNRSTLKCVQATDNPMLFIAVDKNFTGKAYSKVPLANGGTSTISQNAPATVVTKALSDTYKGATECDKTLKNLGEGYTCKPIAGGTYYKITPYITYTFGNNNQNDSNTSKWQFKDENKNKPCVLTDGESDATNSCSNLCPSSQGGSAQYACSGGSCKCTSEAPVTGSTNSHSNSPSNQSQSGTNQYKKCDILFGLLGSHSKCDNGTACYLSEVNGDSGWYCSVNGDVSQQSPITQLPTSNDQQINPNTIFQNNQTESAYSQCLKNQNDKYRCEEAGVVNNYMTYKLVEMSVSLPTREIIINTNASGKLNSYAKAKADCKLPELATRNSVTGNWWCADESGSIDPQTNKSVTGDSCSYNSDCDSGDCRNITKPGTSYRAYYCMEPHDDSRASLIWSANTTLYNTIAGNKLENGQYCLGRSYVCKSNYCADNRFLDTCEDNPFVSESAKNTEQVHIENLQTKYELIIEKNPEAFTKYGRELGMQDCLNNYSVAECIPIPGKDNKAVVEHAIDEAANEYNINLP